MALGLRMWLAPLRLLRGLVPVDEIALTLLLSLRFMAQVTEEMRNLSLGLAARAVPWKQLPSGGGLQVPLTQDPSPLWSEAEQNPSLQWTELDLVHLMPLSDKTVCNGIVTFSVETFY